MKKLYYIIFLASHIHILWLGNLSAQYVPAPGKVSELPTILTGGTLHLGNGQVVQGDLVIDGKKIVAVGPDQTVTYKQATSIDISGKHVYPGFITLASTLGLEETELAAATRDDRETGNVNPSVRALVAYNTDSHIIPTIRCNGVLLAQIAPGGGLFSGTSSVVQLDAWNYEDAVVKEDDGVYMNWPSMEFYTAWWAPPIAEQKKSAERKMKTLEQFVEDAKAYAAAKKSGTPPANNPSLEAMVPVVEGKRKLFIRANGEKQIIAAVAFTVKHGIKMVLVGGFESYLQTDLLASYNIPVVLTRTHRLPLREDDPVDLPFRLPSLLEKAGITFAFETEDHWNERNLSYQAGTARAYGLDPETAVKSLTSYPAQILGIDHSYGTLEAGKSATLIVTEGDALDMMSSTVEHAFIDGRKVNLNNRQWELYKKFNAKYDANN